MESREAEDLRYLPKFINMFWDEYGYAPSVREMARELDISTSTLKSRLDILKLRGIVTMAPSKARTVRVKG